MAEKQKQEEKQQMKKQEDECGDLLVGFNLLPKNCMATIISHSFTSPKDVVRSSLVSSIFKSAAESDSVWENFLPSVYPEILSRYSPESLSRSSSSSSLSTKTSSLLGGFSSKKDFYCKLIEKPILIDCGLKSFGLEKETGKICLMLGARNLQITWGDDPRYWEWGPSSDSRFAEVAKLKRVCWLSITGLVKTRILSPKTIYRAYFVIQVEKVNEMNDIIGRSSIRFLRGCGKSIGRREVFFRKRKRRERHQEGEFMCKRGDGWMEIEMGEFYNDGEEDEEVEMRVSETSDEFWKSGLIVQGMELRPKVMNFGSLSLPLSKISLSS